MTVLAYFAGLVTPIPLYVLYCVIAISLTRTHGVECLVCDHLHVDIDDRRTYAYVLARKAWHRVWWRSRRWHRIAEAARRAKWQRR